MIHSATAVYAALDPDSFPVITADHRAQTRVPRPGAATAAVAADLVALHASRIVSSTELTGPLAPVDAHQIGQLLAGLTPDQLARIQVLLGHAVTTIVAHRRARERQR